MSSETPVQPPGHVALRHGRWSLPGQTCLVTTVTASRRPWFDKWSVAKAVAGELSGCRLWRDNQLHAWVLMPDHAHLLVTLDHTESLSHLMARVKSVSARLAGDMTGWRQPFWARSFHNRALRDGEQLANAAHHLIANPLRAGLVDDIWAWPFWSSEWIPEVSDAT